MRTLSAQVTVVLLLLAGSAHAQTSPAIVFTKSADSDLPAIHGLGSAHSIARFLDAHDIGNSGIFESSGGIFTNESFTAGAISGQINAAPGVGTQGIEFHAQWQHCAVLTGPAEYAEWWLH